MLSTIEVLKIKDVIVNISKLLLEISKQKRLYVGEDIRGHP